MKIEHTPAVNVLLTGLYSEGDPGDRDTPPSDGFVDSNSIQISGGLSEVAEWIANSYESAEGTAADMVAYHESEIEAERDERASARA